MDQPNGKKGGKHRDPKAHSILLGNPQKILPTLCYRNRPLIDTPKPKLMKNHEQTDTPRKRNGRSATNPKHRREKLAHTQMQHQNIWTIPRKTRNKRVHTINGNPERDWSHSNSKPNPNPTHHPALLLLSHTNPSPALSMARAALRTKWATMIRLAKLSRILKIGEVSSLATKRRLIRYLTNPE